MSRGSKEFFKNMESLKQQTVKQSQVMTNGSPNNTRNKNTRVNTVVFSSDKENDEAHADETFIISDKRDQEIDTDSIKETEKIIKKPPTKVKQKKFKIKKEKIHP